MGTTNFDEQKSIQTIQEMLQVSKRKFQSDGILMILWGWIMSVNYLTDYLLRISNVHYEVKWYVKIFLLVLILCGFAFTLFYIFKQRKKVRTYNSVSLRYVWVSMFFSLVLVNVIQFRVLQEINFELQHPIFMVIIAFATVVTGGILRYQLIVYGGISFALLALISSRMPLESQLLMESIAWLIAFVIPGHILYSKRKS
jgi:membrane-associated HD superfamily phosphohydrolase